MAEQDKGYELASEVLKLKGEWEDAKLHLEKAKTAHEYSVRRLVLARQEMNLDRDRTSYDVDWYQEITKGLEYPREFLDALDAVRLVGEPIGAASRNALVVLKKAPIERLVTYMRGHGFEFSTEAPARELHGAFVKQSWAKKSPRTDEWEYVMGK